MSFEDWIKNTRQSTTHMTDKLDLKVTVATPNLQEHAEALSRTAVKRTGSGSDTKVETKTKLPAVSNATASGKKSTDKSTNKKIISPEVLVAIKNGVVSDTSEKSLGQRNTESEFKVVHRMPQVINNFTQSDASESNKVIEHSVEGLRLCRITIDPGQTNLTLINAPIGVLYQCAGPAYEKFSIQLLQLASNPAKYGKDPYNWGRRRTPIPPNSSAVFLGNSHTRQVFQSFMCQYGKDIADATLLQTVDNKGNGVWEVRLHQNITIYGAFNTPHFYSPRWSELLAESLNVDSLDSLDAVVLGHFNTFKESENTTFLTMMKNLTVGMDADFERISPPEIDDVAKVYSGPILSVSMFSEYDVRRHKQGLRKIKSLESSGRANIRAIDGRRYVPYLGECATDLGFGIGTCLSTDKSHLKRHVNGHRCVGRFGGHPDLISWDIAEAIYSLMKH